MSTPLWRQVIEGTFDPFSSSFDRRRSGGTGFQELDTDWRAFQIERDAARAAETELARQDREALELRGQEYVNLAQSQGRLESAVGVAEALGRPGAEPQGPPPALEGIANVLDALKSGVVGGLSGLMGWDIQGDDVDTTKFAVDRFVRQEDIVGNRNRLEVAWERALKGLFGGQSYGFGDFEALRYDEDDPRSQRVLQGLGAFTLDVIFDPLTYFSFGSSVLGRVVASTGVRVASRRVAQEVLEQAGEAAIRTQVERLSGRELMTRVAQATGRDADELLLRTPQQLVDDLFAAKGNHFIEAAADSWSFGNAAAYGARGRTGLYDRLVETVGSELADGVWTRLPADIRGGTRFRVPFRRTVDEFTGMRVPTVIAFPGSQPGRGFDVIGMGNVVRKMNAARLKLRTGPFKFLENVSGARGKSWTNVLNAARAGDGEAIEAYALHFGAMAFDDQYRIFAARYDQAVAASFNAIKKQKQAAVERGLDVSKIDDFVSEAYFKRGRVDAPVPSSPEDVIGVDMVDRLFEATDNVHRLAVEIYGEDAANKLQDYATRMLTTEGIDDLIKRYGPLEGRRRRLAQGVGRLNSSFPKSMDIDKKGNLIVTAWMTPDEIFEATDRMLFIADPFEAVAEYMTMMRRELSRDWALNQLQQMGLLVSIGEDVLRQPTVRKIQSEVQTRMVKVRDMLNRLEKGERIPEVMEAQLEADRAGLEVTMRAAELVEIEPGYFRSTDGLVEVRRNRSGGWSASVSGEPVQRQLISQPQMEGLVPDADVAARPVDWDDVRRGFYDEQGNRIPARQVRMEGTDDPRWVTSTEPAATPRPARGPAVAPDADDARQVSGTWDPWLRSGADADIEYVHKVLLSRIAIHENGGRSVNRRAYLIHKRDLEILEELHPRLRGMVYDDAAVPASSMAPNAKYRIEIGPTGDWIMVENVLPTARIGSISQRQVRLTDGTVYEIAQDPNVSGTWTAATLDTGTGMPVVVFRGSSREEVVNELVARFGRAETPSAVTPATHAGRAASPSELPDWAPARVRAREEILEEIGDVKLSWSKVGKDQVAYYEDADGQAFEIIITKLPKGSAANYEVKVIPPDGRSFTREGGTTLQNTKDLVVEFDLAPAIEQFNLRFRERGVRAAIGEAGEWPGLSVVEGSFVKHSSTTRIATVDFGDGSSLDLTWNGGIWVASRKIGGRGFEETPFYGSADWDEFVQSLNEMYPGISRVLDEQLPGRPVGQASGAVTFTEAGASILDPDLIAGLGRSEELYQGIRNFLEFVGRLSKKDLQRLQKDLGEAIEIPASVIREAYEAGDQNAYSLATRSLSDLLNDLVWAVRYDTESIDILRMAATRIQKEIETDVVPGSGLGGARLPLEDRWRDAHPSMRGNPLVTRPTEDVVYRPEGEVQARLYDRVRRDFDRLLDAGDDQVALDNILDSISSDLDGLMGVHQDPYSAFAATLNLSPATNEFINSTPAVKKVVDFARITAELTHLQYALLDASELPTAVARRAPAGVTPPASGAPTVPGTWSSRKDAGEVRREWIERYAEFDREASPRLTPEEFADLRRSVIEEGFNDPLVLEVGLNGNAVLIEGNHRLVIARELGLENVPVRVVVAREVADLNPVTGRPTQPIQIGEGIKAGDLIPPSKAVRDSAATPMPEGMAPNMQRIGIGPQETPAPPAPIEPGLKRDFAGRYKYTRENGEQLDIAQVRPEGKAQVWRVTDAEGVDIGDFARREDAVAFIEGRPAAPRRATITPENRALVVEIRRAMSELSDVEDQVMQILAPENIENVGRGQLDDLLTRVQDINRFLLNSIEILAFDNPALARRLVSSRPGGESVERGLGSDLAALLSDAIEDVAARAPQAAPEPAPLGRQYFGQQQYFDTQEGVGGFPTLSPSARLDFESQHEAAYHANRVANRVRDPKARVVRDEVWETNRADLINKLKTDYEWLEAALGDGRLLRNQSTEEFDTWVERVITFLQGVDPSIDPFDNAIDKSRYTEAARAAGLDRFNTREFDPVVAAIVRENDLFGPEILAETIKRHFALPKQLDEAEKFFQNYWRPYYTASKSWMTQGRGYGYTSRNIIGSMYNAWLADVRARHFNQSAAMLAARRKARDAANEVLERRPVQAGESTAEAWERVFYGELKVALREGGSGFPAMSEKNADYIVDAYRLFMERNYGGRTARSRTWGELLDRGTLETPRYGTEGVGRRVSELYGGKYVDELSGTQKALNASVDNAWMRHVTRVNESSEDYLRFAAFLRGADTYGLEDGGFGAGTWVVGTQFDYADLSNFERRVMKNIIPFYTWTRRNVPLQIRSVWMEPGKVNRLLRFHEEVMKAWTGEDKEQDSALPDWLRRRGGWMTTMQTPGTDPETLLGQIFGLKEDPIAAFIESPLTDLGMLFNATINPLQLMNRDEIINNLNPILGKAAFEAFTGRSYTSGRELDPDGLAPRWAQPWALVRNRRNDDGELVFSQNWAQFFRNILPPFAQAERLLAPLLGDERMRRRWLTTMGSQLLASPLYTVDPNQQAFAINNYAQGINEALREGIISFEDKRDAARRLLDMGYDPAQIAQLGLSELDPEGLNFEELARARRNVSTEEQISAFLETLPPETARIFIFRRGFRGLRGHEAVEAWENRQPINELGALFLPEIDAAFSDWFARLPESDKLGLVFQYGYGPYRGAEAVQRWSVEGGLPNRPPGLGSADFLS